MYVSEDLCSSRCGEVDMVGVGRYLIMVEEGEMYMVHK